MEQASKSNPEEIKRQYIDQLWAEHARDGREVKHLLEMVNALHIRRYMTRHKIRHLESSVDKYAPSDEVHED